jgi:uncharacterized membrane protein (UPF0127 family)
MKTLKLVKIRNSSSPFTVVNVKYGLIIVENNETRINTAIHMMFMNYDITVLWLDKQMVIIDKVLAKRWVPFYSSKKPAQYVIELHESKFSEYSIGNKLILFNGN